MDDNNVYIHAAHPEAIQANGGALLNTTERERADSFAFAKDRTLYTAAHIFLRRQLSQYAPLQPNEWHFTKNQYGKPFISNPGYEWLQFNLSHTPGLIACAISAAGSIGVDVEQHRSLPDLEGLCRYAFSSEEVDDILSLTSLLARETRFFTYWTLKEAYIKAVGMGLSLPLQQFSFSEDAQHSWHVVPNKVHTSEQTKNWRFDNKCIGRFQLSVATTLTGSLIYHDDYHGKNHRNNPQKPFTTS